MSVDLPNWQETGETGSDFISDKIVYRGQFRERHREWFFRSVTLPLVSTTSTIFSGIFDSLLKLVMICG